VSTLPTINPGEVFAGAWRIYREHFRVLIPTALAVFAAEAVLSAVLSDRLTFIASLVSLIATAFYTGMVVELVRDVQDGRRDSSVGELFRSVAPVVVRLALVSLLFGLAVGLGFLLLIVPGLILMTIWAVVAPVVVIERPGMFAAFGRSRALVRGQGVPVFGVVIVVLLLSLLIGVIAVVLTAPLGLAGTAAVLWVANALVEPFTALAAAVLYFMLVVRKDRWEGEPVEHEAASGWLPPTSG
jgi:hypothetical protein